MFITGFLLAFLLAIILTLLLAVGFRGQAWGAGLAFFFLILFLATWAGGLWLTPVGPLMMGVPWMSFLLVALIVGLILAATTPSRYRRSEKPLAEGKPLPQAAIAVDIFFWLLVAGLLIAIVARYVVAV